jgi:hypothetical protein
MINVPPYLIARTVKTMSALCLMTGLLATVGCHTTEPLPPFHGKVGISVPPITLKQGQVGMVIVTLDRSPAFDRDVAVITTPPAGIEITPRYVAVRATDESIMGVQVTIPRETVPGEYRVDVSGTPTLSDPVPTFFIVKVIAP